MNTLQLMEIKDRTWTIQACSAVTKEGKLFEKIQLSFIKLNHIFEII